MSEDKLKIDGNGNFYKWEKLLEIEAKVEAPSGTSTAAVPTAGKVPGVNFDELLKGHVGKKVKITVEVRNES